jgi:hypothetical protein
MDRSDPSVAGAAAFDIDQSRKHFALAADSAGGNKILQINKLQEVTASLIVPPQPHLRFKHEQRKQHG